ncbi:MAG: lasso peptide biosynthesis PqqD family chaperone [Burkholderiales bacterium]|nr:lasso peptide biosynthesis PqqD family chaperone [Anaerolineae bacterium]
MLSENTIVVAGKEQIATEMGDDVVILGLKTGAYYGLSEVGASIWKSIQQPISISQIREVIMDEYEIDADQCTQDILELLERLTAEGLVDVQNNEAGA